MEFCAQKVVDELTRSLLFLVHCLVLENKICGPRDMLNKMIGNKELPYRHPTVASRRKFQEPWC